MKNAEKLLKAIFQVETKTEKRISDLRELKFTTKEIVNKMKDNIDCDMGMLICGVEKKNKIMKETAIQCLRDDVSVLCELSE